MVRGPLFVLVAALGIAACGTPSPDENSPWMRPGENCLSCHTPNGLAQKRPWTAAGTVFSGADPTAALGLEGAKVILTDAHGKVVELVSNGAGNFYTAETLAYPLTAAVENNGHRVQMPEKVINGACNVCHQQGGEAGTRVQAP